MSTNYKHCYKVVLFKLLIHCCHAHIVPDPTVTISPLESVHVHIINTGTYVTVFINVKR